MSKKTGNITKLKSERTEASFQRFATGKSDALMLSQESHAEAQRFLGAGAPAGTSACCAATLDAIQCDAARIPKHAELRAHFTGPVADATLVEMLTPQWKVLNQGQDFVGATNAIETNIDDGELQQNMLIVGIYVEVIPMPFVQQVEGGVWTEPGAAGNAPVVPDIWTKADATAGNGLGLTGSQTLTKAILDNGGYVQDFAYHLAEAYNLWWCPGGSTILDMPLRQLLHVKGAERGTSPSRRAFAQSVSNTNAFYRGLTGNTAIFLPRNATRTGVMSIGGTEMSTFSPYDYADEDVSYDPGTAWNLCKNPCYYELPYAVAFPRGLNTSLYFRQVDNVATGKAAQALSPTNNLLNSIANGAVPPGAIAPDEFVTTANFVGSGASPVFTDVSKDAAPAQVQFQVPIGTTIVKGAGDYYLAIGFVGWPIGDTTYRNMVDGQQDICSYLMNHTQGRCGFRAVSNG